MCVGQRSKRNKYKECKSQATNTHACSSPRQCDSETGYKLLEHERKLKTLLTSPGFWKLLQKLEATVSPISSSNNLTEAKTETTPVSISIEGPVKAISRHSTNSSHSRSEGNASSAKRSLKTLSAKSSIESFAFGAITINPHNKSNSPSSPKKIKIADVLERIHGLSSEKDFRKTITSKSSSLRLSIESKTSPTVSGKPYRLQKSRSLSVTFRQNAQCSQCVQTVRERRRKNSEISSATNSNISERKSENSSKISKQTSLRSQINKETISSDLKRAVRKFPKSRSESPSPKLKGPIRKKQAPKYNSAFSQTDSNKPRATSRIPATKPEIRRISPINFNKKPKRDVNVAKRNISAVPSNSSMESGKFSVSVLSPTPTPSNVVFSVTTSKEKPKAKPKQASPKRARKEVQKEPSVVSSIPSSEVSRKLITPTLASPGDSNYSEISMSKSKRANSPEGNRNLDRILRQKSLEEFNNLKKMTPHHSIEYVYQNARRLEIEMADRKDSGSIATKLSGRADPVPKTDIYSMFYKSQIFEPNTKGRKPKRFEGISAKVKHPQKGIQVTTRDVYPTRQAGKQTSDEVQVEKRSQFVDVFKLLEETDTQSSNDDLPASRSPIEGWKKSILKSPETKTVEKSTNNRYWFTWRNKPRTETAINNNNNKPGTQVVKRPQGGYPTKKGYLLRRLNTLFDYSTKTLKNSTEQDSAVNSHLNLPVAPASTSDTFKKEGTAPGHTTNNQTQSKEVHAGAKRIPFANEKHITSDVKPNKKIRKAGFKTVSRVGR